MYKVDSLHSVSTSLIGMLKYPSNRLSVVDLPKTLTFINAKFSFNLNELLSCILMKLSILQSIVECCGNELSGESNVFLGPSGLLSLFFLIKFIAAIFLGELVGVFVVLDSLDDPRSTDAKMFFKYIF